jgi:hypothetical protein
LQSIAISLATTNFTDMTAHTSPERIRLRKGLETMYGLSWEIMAAFEVNSAELCGYRAVEEVGAEYVADWLSIGDLGSITQAQERHICTSTSSSPFLCSELDEVKSAGVLQVGSDTVRHTGVLRGFSVNYGGHPPTAMHRLRVIVTRFGICVLWQVQSATTTPTKLVLYSCEL